MKELRGYNLEVRNIEESRIVEGYAIVFNEESRDLGGFTEIISPEALEGVVEKSDIFCLLNHNEERGVLARSKYGTGSLMLWADEIGLKYRFESPNTALGDELIEGIKRGDISTSSFAFTTADDVWEKRSNGKFVRKILKFKELFDVSPVYRPAYDVTTVKVCTRGLNELLEKEKAELDIYYSNLRNKLEC